MAKATQPKPFGPNDLVVAPGKPGFEELTKSSLAGVGDSADTFDQDYHAASTSLSSVPHALKDVDDTIQVAHNAHEGLRIYDAGVPGLYAQAQGALSKTSKAFEGALVLPGAAPAPSPPVTVGPGRGTGGGAPGGKGPAPSGGSPGTGSPRPSGPRGGPPPPQ